MRKFAPQINLDARQLGGRSTGAWYVYDDKVIKWPIADGLTVLLHEIGHHLLQHNKIPCCLWGEFGEEVTAWLWAERTAKKLGILFDYNLAEHYFYRKKYNKRRFVLLNWQHKENQQ
ncbi:MAG: hypothetical protein ACREBU_12075 [Nitrososphaera sp.]